MSIKILEQKLNLLKKTNSNLIEELKDSKKLINVLEEELRVISAKNNKLINDKKKLNRRIKKIETELGYDIDHEVDTGPILDIGEFTHEHEVDIGPFPDIGEFTHEYNTNIQKILIGNTKIIDTTMINKCILEKKCNLNATFEYLENTILDSSTRIALINYINRHHIDEIDFKLDITKDDLKHIIGTIAFNKLCNIFIDDFNKIKIRKVKSSNSVIDFHKDFSTKTLKIPLNSHNEYKGGDLIYLTKNKIHAPIQKLNSMTIHTNNIVHGVTKLTSGIRYSLFILQ